MDLEDACKTRETVLRDANKYIDSQLRDEALAQWPDISPEVAAKSSNRLMRGYPQTSAREEVKWQTELAL